MFNFRNTNFFSALLVICLIVLKAALFYWLLFFVVYIIVVLCGSFFIQLNFFFKSINSLPNNTNRIAITFDDGPSPNTLDVLEVLDKWKVKATFFCIGSEAEKYPEIIKKIHQGGHLIGNHTFSHSNLFPMLGTQKINEDLLKASYTIANCIQNKPLLFRPPFGVTNPKIGRSVKMLGLSCVGWNKRSLDTVSNNSQAILNRVTRNLKAGDIILFHDNLKATTQILDQFLSVANESGIACDRVDSILNIKAYEKIDV
ncbi:MAG: polysaccharide deacetylase family protein [Opitutaceae bacterium]|nr:polysaccharide deacetylase family protein [Cytophagales bacterium]